MFYVFTCKSCGQNQCQEIRIDISKSRFKCKYCRFSTKIKKDKIIGLDLLYQGPFKRGIDASNVCQKMNSKKNKNEFIEFK